MSSQSLGQLLEWAQRELQAAGIETARLDTMVLIEHFAAMDRGQILANLDMPAGGQICESFQQAVCDRAARIPLAYILGYKEFYSRQFVVSKDVLVPRPESEDLISLCLEFLSSKEGSYKIVDIGCGSGILGITLYLENQSFESQTTQVRQNVVLADISPAALDIAKHNAGLMHAPAEFVLTDLLASYSLPDKCVVLANLPYVPVGLQEVLSRNELSHEPSMAIYADGDGLELYDRLFKQINDRAAELKPTVAEYYVATECLTEQQSALDKLALTHGFKQVSHAGLATIYTAS